MGENYWEAADKLPLIGPPPLKDIEDGEVYQYITLFEEHPGVEGVMISAQ